MASNALRSALDRFSRTVRNAATSTGRGYGGMVQVTIVDDSAQNRRGFDRLFDAFALTIGDIPAVMQSTLVPAVKAAHGRNFDSEGVAGRGKWAALAPRTLAERQRLGYGPGPILTRTGALRAHVLGTPAVISRRGSSYELKIKPDRNVDGVPKYNALAMGLANRNLPGRPMVTIGSAEATRITSAFMRGLRDRARANGLR